MMQKFTKQTGQLVWELTKTDFKLRYSGSRAGYLWSVLKPLLMFLTLNVVFSHLFQHQVEHYPLQLLTAVIVWTYFAEGTRVGLTALVSKASLLTKVPTPGIVLVLATSLQATITFALNLLVLGIFFAYYRLAVDPAALAAAAGLSLLTFGLILGFTMLAAPLYVRYRDLHQIWDVVLLVGFYTAPIIYPLSVLPAQYHPFLWLNPMSYIIHYMKTAVIGGEFVPPSALLILTAITAGVLAVGWLTFQRLHRAVVEQL